MAVVIRRISVDPQGFDQQREFVQLHNTGPDDVDMTGWTLTDVLDHPFDVFRFTFPAFTLAADADVFVHTGDGVDDDRNLFWANPDAVWNNAGDEARLADAAGALVDQAQWTGPLEHGLYVDTVPIQADIATLGFPAPDEGLLLAFSGVGGGEIFVQTFGDVAVFHAGYPDSIPPGAPRPEQAMITVGGDLWRRWRGTQGLAGGFVLGRPLGLEQNVGGVQSQRFEAGTLWSTPKGVRLVAGRFLDTWLSAENGGPTGRLGLPLSDALSAGVGDSFEFERGSLFQNPDGSTSVIGRLVIEFAGLHCFGEQSGPGSDEPYLLVAVKPHVVPELAEFWYTVLPANSGTFTTDSGSTVLATTAVYRGRMSPLTLWVWLLENDDANVGDFRNRVRVAVDVNGLLTSSPMGLAIPGSSQVSSTRKETHQIVPTWVNDKSDDLIDDTTQSWTARGALDLAHGATFEEFTGLVASWVTPLLSDGDASYKAYFRFRHEPL